MNAAGPSPARLRMGIAAIVRDERDYLLEWIAFHRVVGFSHFLFADNGSVDGSRDLLAALQEAGLATVLDFPAEEGTKPQLPAYSRLLQACPEDIDVLAFVDADEFILPTDGSTSLSPFVQQVFEPEDVSAVALNWASFGSSGRMFAEDGLVIERFTTRAKQDFSVNHHYKSLVRRGRVEAFDNPHHARLWWGRCVDANGRDLVAHAKQGAGLSTEVVWSGARINHYAVKSAEEFILGKSLKGSASQPGRVKHKQYFALHDRNEEPCSIASTFTPRVHAEMALLQGLMAACAGASASKA
jgi:hypothetical protein